MTIRELIEKLEEVASEYGNEVEVRIAYQPNWPLESSVRCASVIDPKQSDDYVEARDFFNDASNDEEDRAGAFEEMQALEAKPAVVYLVEGNHIGYASRDLWN